MAQAGNQTSWEMKMQQWLRWLNPGIIPIFNKLFRLYFVLSFCPVKVSLYLSQQYSNVIFSWQFSCFIVNSHYLAKHTSAFLFFPSTAVTILYFCSYVYEFTCMRTKDDSSYGSCGQTFYVLLHTCRSIYIVISAFWLGSLPAISQANLQSRHNFPALPGAPCLQMFWPTGYCSRGRRLDTGWHCTAPWAHS